MTACKFQELTPTLMRRQIQAGGVGEVVQVFAPILPVAASRSEWRHSGGVHSLALAAIGLRRPACR